MTRRQALKDAADILVSESNQLAQWVDRYARAADNVKMSTIKGEMITMPSRVAVAISNEIDRLRTIAGLIRPTSREDQE